MKNTHAEAVKNHTHMEEFQELGKAIEQRWQQRNYDENAFPAIAEDALLHARLLERIDPWEIIRWVHRTPNLPAQVDIAARFGNPPITLYMGSRFYIDVYYWLDGTTEIHQHAFSGAFQVLLGSSIHSHYSFTTEREINPYFALGSLRLNNVTLLTMGEVRQIIAGPDYIHALFHLDRPSATITVRTMGTPKAQPQYSYKRPFIAYDPFFKNESTARKLQTVSLLYAMKHPEADKFVSELLEQADFQTSFLVLESAFSYLGQGELDRLFALSANKDRFAALLEQAQTKHGNLVEGFWPVFQEGARLLDIVRRRGTITGEEHRFFLALLLNVSDRERVLELIRSRFPDRDPIETALDWVEELYRTRVLGSNEANALGIDSFNDDYLFVLEGLLKGCSLAEIHGQAITDYPVEQAAALNERVETISNELKSSMLFKSVLA